MFYHNNIIKQFDYNYSLIALSEFLAVSQSVKLKSDKNEIVLIPEQSTHNYKVIIMVGDKNIYEDVSKLSETMGPKGRFTRYDFVACDNGLRQAHDMIYDCCVRQKKCRSILKHVLKRCDNRKSCRRRCRELVACDKIVSCKSALSVPHARGIKEKQVTVHSNTGKPKTITGTNLKPKQCL